MLKILHLSDLQLGWRPASLAPDRAQAWESRRNGVLRKAVDFAISQSIPLVVIAGNLFDRHDPPGPLARAALIELRRLVVAGCTLVTAPGPRDGLVYPESVYRRAAAEWPGTLVQSLRPALALSMTVDERTVHVYGMACSGAPATRGRVVREFPRSAEAGLHVAVFPGLVDDNGSATLPRLDGEALSEAGYDYVALGGLPAHRLRKVGETQAAWSGTVEALGFDHPGSGCWTVIEVEGGGRTRVTPVPVDIEPVVHRTIDITGHPDDRQVRAAMVEASDSQVMARFVLQGLSMGVVDPRRLESQMAGHFFHLEVVDRTRMDVESLACCGDRRLERLVHALQTQMQATRDPGEQQVLDHAMREGVAVLRKEVLAR